MPPSVRVGIVGAGYIAPYHLAALRGVRDARVVAVCDRAHDRAAALARAHGIEGVHERLEDMLAREALDVVHVLLPPPQHASAAGLALDAGAHVLVEKPLATTSEDCRRLASRAASAGRRLGTSHNFLFSRPYERLRADLATGRLGRPEQIEIVWRKPLAQLVRGPYGGWLLDAPTNVLFEIAPHAFAHLVDLIGEPERLEVSHGNPIALPNGRHFVRAWDVIAESGRTRALLRFSFADGYTEHWLRVRGLAASGLVDFERHRYQRLEHGTSSLDVDRLSAELRESAATIGQALRTFARVARSKFGLGGGEPFGESIAAAVRAFYADLASPSALDRRLSSDVAGAAVVIAERIASASGLATAAPSVHAPVAAHAATPPSALVLGGTGFIGRALVERLTRRGIGVRVLSRGSETSSPELAHPLVELLPGDLADPAVLDKALAGVTSVFHLARGSGSTWAEFQRSDVEPTRRLAAACLQAGVRRLVYTSSTVIFDAGRRAGEIGDDTPACPAILDSNHYAHAKAECEALLLEQHRREGLPVVIARPAIVIGRGSDPFHYGVGDWPHPFVCVLWGGGRAKLPLVLVGDVADALVRCGDAPGVEGMSFNLAGEPLLSAQEYLDELERAANVIIRRSVARPLETHLIDTAKWLAKRLARQAARPRPRFRAAVARTAAAPIPSRAARALLGWTPCSDRERLVDEGIRAPLADLLR